MIQSPKFIAFSMALPIMALLGLTIGKKLVTQMGREVTLEISGYDPRDLLAGHYLIYTIDYRTDSICDSSQNLETTTYVCPDERRSSQHLPTNCSYFIKGTCRGLQFNAGIEKFYIPENLAARLEKLVQNKKGSVVLSVLSNGQAQVKQLLIEGKPWNEFIESERESIQK